MKKITERIICKDCPKIIQEIKSEGKMFDVEYVILKSNMQYIICDNENVAWNDIMPKISNFVLLYVPRFGKYEIEEFIGYFMRVALLITKDITDLFNMNLLCDDSPFNVTEISSKIIKERLLECFNVIKKVGNTTYLEFKWEEVK